jgi:osmotically-inducible protein OsmY
MTPASATATRRADPDIFIDAKEALDHLSTAPVGVRVHVLQGVVTLTGGVQWPGERAQAEDAVRRIDGVRQIVNNIIVFHGVSKEGFDAPDDRH